MGNGVTELNCQKFRNSKSILGILIQKKLFATQQNQSICSLVIYMIVLEVSGSY